MKLKTSCAALLKHVLLLGLILHTVYAESSTKKTENKNVKRQAYLPPGITEEYITIQEEYVQPQQQSQALASAQTQRNTKSQPKFSEANYGNSHYQIFEVHNHYVAPKSRQTAPAGSGQQGVRPSTGATASTRQQHSSPVQSSFNAEGYLPPQTASAVNAHSHGTAIQQQQHGSSAQSSFSADGYLPPETASTLPIQEPGVSIQQQQVSSPAQSSFSADGYLPPQTASAVNAQSPGTVLQQQQHGSSAQSSFSAQGYLPPQTASALPVQEQRVASSAQSSFNGQGYLPPQTASAVNAQSPGTTIQQQQHDFSAQSSFSAQGYLPPQTASTPGVSVQQQQISSPAQSSFNAQGYLPPQTASAANAQSPGAQLQSHQHPSSVQPNFSAQDYSPPSATSTSHLHAGNEQPVAPAGDEHSDTSFASFASGNGQSINQTPGFTPSPIPPALIPSLPAVAPPLLPPAPLPTASVTVPLPFSSNYHQSGQQAVHQNQNSVYRAPEYLPPTGNNAIHTHANVEQSHQSHHGQQAVLDYSPPHNVESASAISPSGDAYQPPSIGPVQSQLPQQQQVAFKDQSAFKGPDYLPPHAEGQPHSSNSGNGFKGPDYLPPSSEHSAHAQYHQQQQQQQFKGPDYLPPHEQHHDHHHDHHHQEQQIQGQSAYKGPDYLPPNQEGRAIDQTHTQSVDTHSAHIQHSQQQFNQQHQVQAPFKGPDYLPPQQQSHGIPHNPDVQQKQAPPLPVQSQFNGPDYLPPHSGHAQQPLPHPEQFKGPDYLPPTQQSSGFSQNQQQQQHAGQSVPAGTQPVHPSLTHSAPSIPSAPANAPNAYSLPAGYDFEKPENAEAAIAELHSLQRETQRLQEQQKLLQQQLQQQQHQRHQQQQQQQQQQQHLQHSAVVSSSIKVGDQNAQRDSNVIYGQQQQILGTPGFQADGYLPPTSSAGRAQSQALQTSFSSDSSSAVSSSSAQQDNSNLQSVAPQTFEPAPAPVSAPLAPHSSPTTAVQSVQHSSTLNSLNAFMSNVQPFSQRYGDAQFSAPRRPFPEYGPPPNSQPSNSAPAAPQQHNQQQSAPIETASIYQEQAGRSQHYAPGQSYSNQQQHQHQNSVSVSHESTQRQQQLPQQLRPPVPAQPIPTRATPGSSIPAPVAHHTASPSATSSSGKIRTVQIVNARAVKNLKVLETSDHAGVKTIKILGTSNKQPMGAHRVIKVVTQNGHNAHESHVQTVKIFNDQEDVGVNTVAAYNAYLPPSARLRVSRQIDLTENDNDNKVKKYRPYRPFTGRRLYRF